MSVPPRVAVVIPCSKEKAWDAWPSLGAVPAAQAYTSPLHRACQGRAVALARAQGWPWFILSALHGLLRPDDRVPESYDVTFSRPDDPVIDDAALAAQLATLGLTSLDRWLVFCPDDYATRLQQAAALAGAASRVVPVFAGIDLHALDVMAQRATRAPVASGT